METKITASLTLCKHVLAKLYNSHTNMTLALKIEILEALGYGADHTSVGHLLADNAFLNEDGIICYREAVAESKEWNGSR